MTVFDAFAETAGRHPDNEFLVVPASACRSYAEGDLRFTYAEAMARVLSLREAYEAAGLGRGMRVAALLENRPDYFFHWFALNALGVSLVPVNPDYRSAELAYLLGHSESVLAVSIGRRVADLKAAAPALPVVDASEVLRGLSRVRGQTVETAEECALLYTSGTTGKPKGCLLSNDYFLRMGQRYLARRGYVELEEGRSRVLTPLPMFHMNAMAGSTMGVILSASCLIQLDRFHPKTWWSDVVATGATGVHYLGVMPAILLALPRSSDERAHRVRYGAGANVEPEHHAAFEERFGFPLIEGWAMTETGAGAAISADAEPRHVGTRCFGKVPSAIELRLVDDAGNDAPAGQPGEMLVRRAGPDKREGFFSGYLKDEAATEAAWGGGWWHTGDVARFGSDGSLHFVDRKKNVIRRSGENISALEVEAVLQQHPAIRLVAVSPVADELRGEEVMACIVSAETGTTGEAIVDWTMERIAYFKAPGWIAFVPELPTTATQKLQRGEIRALATSLVANGKAIDLRARKRRAPG